MTPTPDTGSLAGTALETLGSLLDRDLGRDAIHLATICVTSDERVYPGQEIGLAGELKVSPRADKLIGIVDPFIKGSVNPGLHFWLVLYPRTITSLRHAWTHPAFESATLPETRPNMLAQPKAEMVEPPDEDEEDEEYFECSDCVN